MKYEFMCIIKPFLPEDVRVKLHEHIKKNFESVGGKIVKEDIWGKRHLAYKIKGHEEGYYILFDLELPKEKVDEVSKELRLMGDLLRFVIIGKEEK